MAIIIVNRKDAAVGQEEDGPDGQTLRQVIGVSHARASRLECRVSIADINQPPSTNWMCNL